MLQYFINTSLIWLACLLVYELLLRKERFHQYNRIYLLASLAAGLLLPAANLNTLMATNTDVLRQPAQKVYEIKKQVYQPSVPISAPPARISQNTQASASPDQNMPALMLLWIYLAGVIAGLVLVARELFKLGRLYAAGSKTKELSCAIIETGKAHCPFSFFNIVFVGNRSDYSPEQWTLLLTHEKEHGRQLHSLDNLLMIALRIAFWFHPLPYIYYRRLRIVHEYQADNVAAANPAVYGAFLLEQSMLRGAPILTHSFNYSPIKNRIAMLTGSKTTRARLLKYLTVIPLSLGLILFCTQVSFSGEASTKMSITHFNGNEITMEKYNAYPSWYYDVLEKQKTVFLYTPQPDSIPFKDWRTGAVTMIAVREQTRPATINGKPVFSDDPLYKLAHPEVAYVKPMFRGPKNDLDQYLFSSLHDELNKLPDGVYILQVNNLVVDQTGSIAYYEAKGILPDSDDTPVIDDNLKSAINEKLSQLLDSHLKFKPASRNGEPVNVQLQLNAHRVEVKNHAAVLVARGGC
jgi:beta-lactamase regulating signal transducer with metallopeptidase domain